MYLAHCIHCVEHFLCLSINTFFHLIRFLKIIIRLYDNTILHVQLLFLHWAVAIHLLALCFEYQVHWPWIFMKRFTCLLNKSNTKFDRCEISLRIFWTHLLDFCCSIDLWFCLSWHKYLVSLLITFLKKNASYVSFILISFVHAFFSFGASIRVTICILTAWLTNSHTKKHRISKKSIETWNFFF